MHLEKFPADSVLFDFDCTNILAADETITGAVTMAATPAFDAESPATLVFGTPVVNTQAISYPDGRVMAIGKGFQVRISAGQAETLTQKRVYAVTGTFGTTAEDNTLTTKAPLWVLPIGLPQT